MQGEWVKSTKPGTRSTDAKWLSKSSLRIKLGPEGQPKVLDFGLAKAFEAEFHHLPGEVRTQLRSQGREHLTHRTSWEEGQGMKVQRISAITIRVSDMSRSVLFYNQILGLEISHGGENAYFSSLRTKGANQSILNLVPCNQKKIDKVGPGVIC